MVLRTRLRHSRHTQDFCLFVVNFILETPGDLESPVIEVTPTPGAILSTFLGWDPVTSTDAVSSTPMTNPHVWPQLSNCFRPITHLRVLEIQIMCQSLGGPKAWKDEMKMFGPESRCPVCEGENNCLAILQVSSHMCMSEKETMEATPSKPSTSLQAYLESSVPSLPLLY